AVYIDCDNAGEIMLQGAGAGSRPTASAVVSDIFAIAEKL
ncbi:MAG: homoserine dehydrogenase, partial [Proteocatella sp.]|nr:homoserine dehydrogenase [Proteocatella sp.]MBP9967165.1 homoserine dehydrogenase [Proteocatella sp.]